MIGGIIEKIRAAEQEADAIVLKATLRAQEIEQTARAEIEALEKIANENTAKRIQAINNTHTKGQPLTEPEITVDNTKIEKAKKYIIKSFNERFGGES